MAKKVQIDDVYTHNNGCNKIKVTKFLGTDHKSNRLFEIKCLSCLAIYSPIRAATLTCGRFNLCPSCTAKKKDTRLKVVEPEKKKAIEVKTSSVIPEKSVIIPAVIETPKPEKSVYYSAKVIDVKSAEINEYKKQIIDLQSLINVKEYEMKEHAEFLRKTLENILGPNENSKIEEAIVIPEQEKKNTDTEVSRESLLELQRVMQEGKDDLELDSDDTESDTKSDYPFDRYERRERLAKFQGQRPFFKMTFEKYGISRRTGRKTMLFTNITDLNGELQAGHQWFPAEKFNNMNIDITKGDTIEFTAEVRQYETNRYHENTVVSENKYALTAITNCRKVGRK